MNPSQPGYNFSTADLIRFNVSPLEAARILARTSEGNPASTLGDPTLALLAELVRSQRRFNAQYGPFGFQLAIWRRLQVLPQNPLRSYLLIQNTGSGDVMVLFEPGPASVVDLSGASGQAQLTVDQVRAVRIVGGGNYEPLVAPTNEITIFSIGTATNGVVVEGV